VALMLADELPPAYDIIDALVTVVERQLPRMS
jgi:hypothetical protein